MLERAYGTLDTHQTCEGKILLLMFMTDQIEHVSYIPWGAIMGTLYRYCCSPVIKVTDLEYYIFIAFTLIFGVKSLLSEGGGISRGYT